MKYIVDKYEIRDTKGNPCPNCRKMSKALDEWIQHHPEHEVKVNTFNAADPLYRDWLVEDIGARTAPAICVKRGKDKPEWVSGLNIDVLIDVLDGENLWVYDEENFDDSL